MKKHIWVNVFFTVFYLSVSLGMAEGLVRYFHPVHPSYVRLEETPCLTAGQGVNHQKNRWGFHDREYKVEKQPGTFRIVVLGDSQTFGAVHDTRDTFPSWLERRLKERGHTRVEVLNFGVPGTSTGDQLCLAENFIHRFDPDLVLFAMFPSNDVMENEPAVEWVFYRFQWVKPDWIPESAWRLPPVLERVVYRSHLLRLISAKPWQKRPSDFLHWGVGTVALQNMVDRWVEAARRQELTPERFRRLSASIYAALDGVSFPADAACPPQLVTEFEAWEQGTLPLGSLGDRIKDALLARLREIRREKPEWTVAGNPFALLWSEMRLSRSYVESSPALQPQWAETFARLEKMQTVLEAKGLPWAAVLLPSRGQTGPFYGPMIAAFLDPQSPAEDRNFSTAHKRLSVWFKKRDIPVLDGLDVLEAAETPDGLFLPHDVHYSPEGNRLWGGALADFLEREALLPPLSTEEED